MHDKKLFLLIFGGIAVGLSAVTFMLILVTESILLEAINGAH